MNAPSAVYVFGFIRDKQPQTFGTVPMNDEERKVYSIHHNDVGIVICKVDGEVLPNKENLFSHQNLLTRVMQKYDVIPMSFGNVFHSEEDILFITQHLSDQFTWLFPEIENKIEVGLKITIKQSWLDEKISQDPKFQEWKKKSNKKRIAASYYEQVKVGEYAQQFFQSLQQTMDDKLYLPLSKLAASSKHKDLMSEKILLNAAFLIDRNKETEFDLKVNELYEKWKDKVEFKYTGPWPAYHFVNIKLNIEGGS